MVKIVGKIVIILFLITSFFNSYCVELTLKAVTLNGHELEKVAAGKDFLLEVATEGAISCQEPKVAGIEKFDVTGVSHDTSEENGKKTGSYILNVKIDKPGVYNVGPAEIEYNNNTYRSNDLTIEVSEDQVLKHKKSVARKVFFDLIADKQNVVLGEKIILVIRFYFLDDKKIKLDRIIPADAPGLRKTGQAGPFGGQEKIGEDLYNYIAYRWDLFPDKIGSITLPAHRADFSLRVKNGLFGGFSAFFGNGYEQKNIFSNVLTFNVLPLPEYDGVVDAVGRFKNFSASVDRAAARQGDGIVLTLELEGEGDLENLSITELKDMPSELKYYDSKSYLVDDGVNSGVRKKRFEFIIQGTQEGEYNIPWQTFTFFDAEKRKYKTLKTSEIILRILPAATKTYMVPKPGELDAPLAGLDEAITPIDQYGTWYAVPQREIPLWIFILLFLIPFVPLCVLFAKKIIGRIKAYYSPHVIKTYAFVKAIKSLKSAQKQNDFSKIYSIFITFFSERFGLQESAITQDAIINMLRNNSFSQEQINEWEYFIAKISSYVFYEKEKIGTFDAAIFDKAIAWIEIFKERL